MEAGHTNENKQFWPKYKIITITEMWKYSIFTEPYFGYKRKQLKEYIPPHVHMHSSDPY